MASLVLIVAVGCCNSLLVSIVVTAVAC